jgi:hypothetical protein
VELGRKLANDPNYPPEHVVDQLAKILAGMPMDWVDDFVDDFESK